MTRAASPMDASSADARAWQQFLRYWYGHIASFSGDWFTVLALPLAALAINDSPLFIGVVEFAELVATLAIGMRVGALADRLPPRVVMIGADVVRAVLVGTMAVLFLSGAPHEVLLVIVAFALGAMRDLHDGAESVMMSAVVPESLLVRANSRFQISDGLGHMLGSLLAGVAASISLSLAFGVDALSYLVAALAVWAMGHFTVPRSAADEPDHEHEPIAPWRSTWRVARTEDRYWRVLVTMCVTNITTVCFMGQFVTFATKELGLANWQIGLTLSVMGFGSFTAGVALDRIGSISPRTILVAPAVIGLTPILAGLTRSWPVVLGAFCIVGMVMSLGGALIGSMRHASFDAAVQGRMALASRIGFSAGVLPGVLIAGQLAQSVGAAQMYVIFGGIGLIGLAVGVVLGVGRLATLTGRPAPTPSDADLTDLTDLTDHTDDTTVIVLPEEVDLRARPVPVPPELTDAAVQALLAEALRSVERNAD